MTTKADTAAADRLLRAAVRKARDTIREAPTTNAVTLEGVTALTYRDYDHRAVVAMLTAAGESAALLYGEGA